MSGGFNQIASLLLVAGMAAAGFYIYASQNNPCLLRKIGFLPGYPKCKAGETCNKKTGKCEDGSSGGGSGGSGGSGGGSSGGGGGGSSGGGSSSGGGGGGSSGGGGGTSGGGGTPPPPPPKPPASQPIKAGKTYYVGVVVQQADGKQTALLNWKHSNRATSSTKGTRIKFSIEPGSLPGQFYLNAGSLAVPAYLNAAGSYSASKAVGNLFTFDSKTGTLSNVLVNNLMAAEAVRADPITPFTGYKISVSGSFPAQFSFSVTS